MKKVLFSIIALVLVLGIALPSALATAQEECWETVWQIGDVEASQMDNACDEFNFDTIVFGTQDFFVGTTPTSDFPWISRYDKNYAPTINIHFSAGMPSGGRLVYSWSPGASGYEAYDVELDSNLLGSITKRGYKNCAWFRCGERFIETFDIGPLASGAHTLTFRFTSGNGSLWDWIRLEQPCNQPPDCSGAYADPGCLWPPNHKFVDIGIMGVTDPDGDPVTITITGITSDEPTASDKVSGGAKHAPDAYGVGTDTASVRAERSGNGDGRVYEISFTAADASGAACSGTVTVNVPHDQSDKSCPAVDSGQNYDATQIN